MAVNTGALPEGTFESELFGHVKGAFTDARADRIGRFELANGGTLFLDEIANIPVRQQAKLLRVLETGELERVGSSKTQNGQRAHDLRNQCGPASGVRGRTLPRRPAVPSEYRGDQPAAVAGATRRYSGVWRRIFWRDMPRVIEEPIQGLSRPHCRLMLHHGWPGNVRELDHTIERAVLMARGERIEVGRPGFECAAGLQRRAWTR